MIVRGKSELEEKYHVLGPDDVFIGGLAGKGRGPLMLADLLERGVTCLPSPLCQMLNSSKVAQAIVLKDHMSPHTLAIFRRHELMAAISVYNQNKIGRVITKTDEMHCGHGVRKWEDIEKAYSFLSHTASAYPFLLQPFLEDFKDVRVIIAGDYLEAYRRENPDNFRQNISAGGRYRPFTLNDEQKTVCREVMSRGKFPYGHIDLQVFDGGPCYLSEIALNGGMKGASIQRKILDQKKQEVLEGLASKDVNKFGLYSSI